MSTVHCPRCARRVRPNDRSILWWAVLLGACLVFVAMVLAASLVGPFIVGLIPFMAVFGFAFGPLVSILKEGPTCPRCGRSLSHPHRDAGASPSREREGEESLTPSRAGS